MRTWGTLSQSTAPRCARWGRRGGCTAARSGGSGGRALGAACGLQPAGSELQPAAPSLPTSCTRFLHASCAAWICRGPRSAPAGCCGWRSAAGACRSSTSPTALSPVRQRRAVSVAAVPPGCAAAARLHLRWPDTACTPHPPCTAGEAVAALLLAKRALLAHSRGSGAGGSAASAAAPGAGEVLPLLELRLGGCNALKPNTNSHWHLKAAQVRQPAAVSGAASGCACSRGMCSPDACTACQSPIAEAPPTSPALLPCCRRVGRCARVAACQCSCPRRAAAAPRSQHCQSACWRRLQMRPARAAYGRPPQLPTCWQRWARGAWGSCACWMCQAAAA